MPRPNHSSGLPITLILFAWLVPVAQAQTSRIRIAAASDLQTVMPQIAAAFERQANVGVDFTYGSSGNFFAQIRNGAPFDLFFSADSEFPSKLVQDGIAEPRSARVYALGALVLWVPEKSDCDPRTEKWECLLKPAVQKIAIANPAHAPYGRAAISALQFAHVYDRVRTRFVLGENISQAAQFARSGQTQAGILARSQMESPVMRTGKFWEVPKDSYAPIEQSLVILKSSKAKSVAQQFIRFVTEGEGRAILEKAGLQPPPVLSQPQESHK